MRLRRSARSSTLETIAGDPARLDAWNGFVGVAGPAVVIKATRAGELIDHPEALQVA